jgi:hypothetical protein
LEAAKFPRGDREEQYEQQNKGLVPVSDDTVRMLADGITAAGKDRNGRKRTRVMPGLGIAPWLQHRKAGDFRDVPVPDMIWDMVAELPDGPLCPGPKPYLFTARVPCHDEPFRALSLCNLMNTLERWAAEETTAGLLSGSIQGHPRLPGSRGVSTVVKDFGLCRFPVTRRGG